MHSGIVFFAHACVPSSPYINRFLQPDSIIPSPSNPQSWNRYSYVVNNPLRYVDPTGHAWDDCSKFDSDVECKRHMQHVGKIKGRWAAEDAKLRRGSADLVNYRAAMQLSLSSILGVSSFGGNLRMPQFLNIGSAPSAVRGGQQMEMLNVPFADYFTTGFLTPKIDSWDGRRQIDPNEWNELRSKIRDDIHRKPGMLLFYQAVSYDTPFFNGGRFGGNYSGTGCFGENCYDRSELNYVAQGELWAALGVSNDTGHDIVRFWKEAKCGWMCDRNDLQEEYDMFDNGYYYYQELYPPHPTGQTIPSAIPPWMLPDS